MLVLFVLAFPCFSVAAHTFLAVPVFCVCLAFPAFHCFLVISPFLAFPASFALVLHFLAFLLCFFPASCPFVAYCFRVLIVFAFYGLCHRCFFGCFIAAFLVFYPVPTLVVCCLLYRLLCLSHPKGHPRTLSFLTSFPIMMHWSFVRHVAGYIVFYFLPCGPVGLAFLRTGPRRPTIMRTYADMQNWSLGHVFLLQTDSLSLSLQEL